MLKIIAVALAFMANFVIDNNAYAEQLNIPSIAEKPQKIAPAVPIAAPENKSPANPPAPRAPHSLSSRHAKAGVPADNHKKHVEAPKKAKPAVMAHKPVHQPAAGAVSRFAGAPKPLGPLMSQPTKHKIEQTRFVSAKPVQKQYEPTIIVSGTETHEVAASGTHENTFRMPRKILQAFSSRKLSVEIRGPVLFVKIPSGSGTLVDLQVLTDDFHVENFILHVDDRLPAQKFIVKKNDDEDQGFDPLRNTTYARKIKGHYGGAIDTLILIANGKDPKGFTKQVGSEKEVDFRGLKIRHIGSYVRRNAEFAIYSVRNETDGRMEIREWNLHNSTVLGSVSNVREVQFMSLDRYSLASGESTYLYVAYKHSGRKDQ